MRWAREVTLVSGPVTLADPPGVNGDARRDGGRDAGGPGALPADIGFFTAAVADWRWRGAAEEKIKKTVGGAPALKLTENPDILRTIAKRMARRRPRDRVRRGDAERRRVRQEEARVEGRDWIVANDVSPATNVMGGDRNTVHIVTDEGVESWPEMDKDEVAARLVARAAEEMRPSVEAMTKSRPDRRGQSARPNRGRLRGTATCE